jgi:ribA/ribD-fused uncharacterized protein
MTAVIHFYLARQEYGEFSNFARYPLLLEGKTWPTAEHYYQAQKHLHDPEYAEAIRQAASPLLAAKMGRDPRHPLRADWEQVKDAIMYQVVLAKFTQHPALRTLLLDTGDQCIIEHTHRDAYWADAGDGTGKNRLGEILMQVRSALRAG